MKHYALRLVACLFISLPFFARAVDSTTSSSKKKRPRVANPAYVVDPSLSTVTLRLGHSLMGRFETSGKGGLKGRIELQEGKKLVAAKLDFNADTFESLISLRDEHIKKEYLETAKFPIISLSNATAPLGNFKLKKEEKWLPLTGTLVVKNAPVSVTGKSQAYIADEVLQGLFEFDGKISEFPIKKPNYKGVGVEDAFTVIVDLVAKPDLGDDDLGTF